MHCSSHLSRFKLLNFSRRVSLSCSHLSEPTKISQTISEGTIYYHQFPLLTRWLTGVRFVDLQHVIAVTQMQGWRGSGGVLSITTWSPLQPATNASLFIYTCSWCPRVTDTPPSNTATIPEINKSRRGYICH